jgi:citrate lyase subunit beta / citryl-CoA lyase
MTILRSLLFCPATAPDKVLKVPTFGADATAIDLEDAVSDSEKTAARDIALTTIAHPLFQDNTVYVRVNSVSTARTFDDIRTVIHPHLVLI